MANGHVRVNPASRRNLNGHGNIGNLGVTREFRCAETYNVHRHPRGKKGGQRPAVSRVSAVACNDNSGQWRPRVSRKHGLQRLEQMGFAAARLDQFRQYSRTTIPEHFLLLGQLVGIVQGAADRPNTFPKRPIEHGSGVYV